MIPDKIHNEINRLAEAAFQNYGLTKFQKDMVENLMYRTANIVLAEQARQREAVTKDICKRVETVTVRGIHYPVKDFVGEI